MENDDNNPGEDSPDIIFDTENNQQKFLKKMFFDFYFILGLKTLDIWKFIDCLIFYFFYF